MSCSYDAEWGGYLNDYGDPCYPDENQPYGGGSGGGYYGGGGGGGGWFPNVTITPQGSQVLGTSLDKWLNYILSQTAILTHQGAIPTTVSQPNNVRYPTNVLPGQVGVVGQPLGGGSLGGTVGSQLQKFISSPTGLLVIGAAVLLYMKPPGRR